jgi:hypothetical protein
VVRRCRLNLIELQSQRIVVYHWGKDGRGDLRPFFTKHFLAKRGTEVVVIDRKQEIITSQPSADFLDGEPLAEDFPLPRYLRKWRPRKTVEAEDGIVAAPC